MNTIKTLEFQADLDNFRLEVIEKVASCDLLARVRDLYLHLKEAVELLDAELSTPKPKSPCPKCRGDRVRDYRNITTRALLLRRMSRIFMDGVM